MSIQHIILGYLYECPQSGYALKKAIADVPFFHSSANNNQIYKALLSLHEEGLVEFELQTKDRGAASKVYTLTDLGVTKLREWAASCSDVSEHVSAFHQHLAFAHTLSRTELEHLLNSYAAELEDELNTAKELQRRFNQSRQNSSDTPEAKLRNLFWDAIYGHRVKHYELERKWLQETKEKVMAFGIAKEGVTANDINL
ncbi:MAG: helix-turn-helix transcriptional regulator [Trueperaceae bacterium]|nr:helix-turn-helix transcriptional regulator [Trueperaceae bacterium]